MRSFNDCSINNWNTRNILIIILSAQISMIGLIALDELGLHVPLLRQFVGFFYITFVPGILLLQFLNVKQLDGTKTILYSLGLSLWTVMILGLLMNSFYPFLGVNQPISLLPLLATISSVVIFLCAIIFIRDNGILDIKINYKYDQPFRAFCLLLIIPIISILGAHLVNINANSAILLVLILVISVIFIVITVSNQIDTKVYPFLIFSLALSLLFHNSLISGYLVGYDINFEYRVSEFVKLNGIWDYSIYSNLNSVLSIVILPNIYSIILDIDGIWVYKLVYPFCFAFVPVGLYRSYKDQFGSTIALSAVLYFISLLYFYIGISSRQLIAEIFLMLVIVIMFSDRKVARTQNKLLFIIFSSGIVISHYGLTYLCLGIFLISLAFIYIFFHKDLSYGVLYPLNVFLFMIMGLSWYMFVSSSSSFTTLVSFGNNVISSIFIDILNPTSNQALSSLSRDEISVLNDILKYLYYISMFFILVGVADTVVKIWLKKYEYNYIYALFSISCFIILLLSVTMPNVNHMGINRVYHILLFILSPVFIIGGLKTFELINIKGSKTINLLTIFISIFLLFNSGFVNEILNDNPKSISLSPYIDSTRFNQMEAFGATWISNYSLCNSTLYGDEYATKTLASFIHLQCQDTVLYSFKIRETLNNNSYVFLRSWNINTNEIFVQEYYSRVVYKNFHTNLEQYFSSNAQGHHNEIYTNGGSKLYFYRTLDTI